MGLMRRSRRRGLIVGAAVGSAAARRGAANQAEEPAVAPEAAPAPEASSDPVIEQIKQLSELKNQGILTQEEFDAKKKQLLGL